MTHSMSSEDAELITGAIGVSATTGIPITQVVDFVMAWTEAGKPEGTAYIAFIAEFKHKQGVMRCGQ